MNAKIAFCGFAVLFILCSTTVLAAPIIPYNQYGLAYKDGILLPENSTIYAWIDGVCYGNARVNLSGGYDLVVNGDDVTVENGTIINPVKEGGIDNDMIYFTYVSGNQVFFANETAVYQNGSSVEMNLTFYATVQKALIYEIVAEPGDGGTDYIYLYFPDIASLNLQEWKIEKCGNGSYSAWSALLANLTTQVYPSGSNFLYVDLGANVLSGSGGSLKLLYYFSSANAWLCVDRVEWNASTGGTHNYAPSNTIMPDAVGASTSGMSIKRIGMPPVDTDNCTADFIVSNATERPPTFSETLSLAILALIPVILYRKREEE